MTYKVAIVGPSSITAGFGALGVVQYSAQSSLEAQKVITRLVAQTNDETQKKEKYAIIIVIEEFLQEISEKDYKILTKNIFPSIVAVPGVKGSQGYMTEKLREYTIRAIGSDIM